MAFDRESVRFLFQTYEGAIDRQTWRSGTLVLLAILVPLTLIWLWIAPATHRDLSNPELLDVGALGAFIYLLLFAFAVILIAVSWTNLSGKRFRSIGMPGAYAGGAPIRGADRRRRPLVSAARNRCLPGLGAGPPGHCDGRRDALEPLRTRRGGTAPRRRK